MYTQGYTTIMMQGEGSSLHQESHAMEANYAAGVTFQNQLTHDREQDKEELKKRDELIVKLEQSIFDELHKNVQLKEQLSKGQNVSELWETWQTRARMLEEGQREVKDLLTKREKAQGLDNTKLQKALQESKGRCDALEEQLSKQLAEKEERHQLELSETAEEFRRQLADQAEKLRQEFSAREEIFLRKVSEKEDSLKKMIAENIKLSERQANQGGNIQPQELKTEKEAKKKKSFWRRLFQRRKRTAEPSPN